MSGRLWTEEDEQRARIATNQAALERVENLLRRHAHPVAELTDDGCDPFDDPTAYLFGELERARDRVRRRSLPADAQELLALVIADMEVTGFLDVGAAQDPELREQIAFYLTDIEINDQAWPS
jgi:hypothetical protein